METDSYVWIVDLIHSKLVMFECTGPTSAILFNTQNLLQDVLGEERLGFIQIPGYIFMCASHKAEVSL